MPPRNSMDYSPNCLFAYIENLCQSRSRKSPTVPISVRSAYYTNLPTVKLGGLVGVPERHCTISKFVEHILFWCSPIKIFNRIIVFTVDTVASKLTLGAFRYKCGKNKIGNRFHVLHIFYLEANAQISTWSRHRFELSWDFGSFTMMITWLHRINRAIIGSEIIWKIGNWFNHVSSIKKVASSLVVLIHNKGMTENPRPIFNFDGI